MEPESFLTQGHQLKQKVGVRFGLENKEIYDERYTPLPSSPAFITQED